MATLGNTLEKSAAPGPLPAVQKGTCLPSHQHCRSLQHSRLIRGSPETWPMTALIRFFNTFRPGGSRGDIGSENAALRQPGRLEQRATRGQTQPQHRRFTMRSARWLIAAVLTGAIVM